MTLSRSPLNTIDFGERFVAHTENITLTPETETTINSITLPAAYSIAETTPFDIIEPYLLVVTYTPKTFDDSGDIVIDYTEKYVPLMEMTGIGVVDTPEIETTLTMAGTSSVDTPEIETTLTMAGTGSVDTPEIETTLTMAGTGSIE